jgi:hypothetical protein
MRFAIMQATPGYWTQDSAAEEAIAGQEGTVLRLLILHRGRPLTMEEIARHLTRPGKHAVRPSSVPGYIARLRSRIGQDCVRSTAGYASAVDPAEVDAFAFESRIEEYGVCEIADVDNMPSGFTDNYEQLLDLHTMWRANPVLPFADDEDDEFLVAAYHEFERYWDCLRRCIIYTELRSRRKPRIEKAISRIEQLLKQDPDDEQSWALLFRARASLPGRETAIAAILARIHEQFPYGIPGELSYTINRITSGHNDALFQVDRSQRTHADQQRLDQLVQAIGISPASELELRRSTLEPQECIRQTVSRLCFAGILATKWVADSYVRNEFAKLLERLDNNGGSAQFLLIDPESESYRRFSQLRWSSGGAQPIDLLRNLSAAHRSLQVRLYDALPTFRIVIIDQSIVSFSPYLIERRTDGNRTGWEAPHIVLDRTAPWPLARAFETLFNETWRTATPLLPLAGNSGGSGSQLVMGRDEGQRTLGVRDVGVVGRAQQAPRESHMPFPAVLTLRKAGLHGGSYPVQVRGQPRQRSQGRSGGRRASRRGQLRLAGAESDREFPPRAEPGEEHGLGTGVHAPHQQVDR